MHTLVKDFGRFDVDHIDSPVFGRAAYPVIFTGKLVWAGQTKNGENIDEDATRIAEVKRLEGWIDRSMQGRAPTTRIITVDLNDDRESPGVRRAKKCGAPYTSSAFTSDHQFVTADIPLRQLAGKGRRTQACLGRAAPFAEGESRRASRSAGRLTK